MAGILDRFKETLEELNSREIKSRKGWTRKKAFLEEEAPFLQTW